MLEQQALTLSEPGTHRSLHQHLRPREGACATLEGSSKLMLQGNEGGVGERGKIGGM